MERPPVQLRILGTTELSAAGERTGSFVLRQPKRLALLAYLALATAGGYRRRDHIVALFWPELDQTHARTQLRKVLHALRSTLGNDAFASRGEEELRLDLSRVWCDAVDFAGLIKEGRWPEALELYRGDLLEGLFPGGVGEKFETWLEDQRSALREQAARAAWECSGREDLAGHRAEAVAFARRALELDPDDEEAVRRLIAVLDRYGDRAGALRLFRDWQARLQADYGADPAPETRKLVRKVQAPRQGESLETPPSLRFTGAPEPRSSAGDLEVAPLPVSIPARPRRPTVLVSAVAVLVAGLIGITSLKFSDTRRSDDAARKGGATATIAVLPLRVLGDSTASRVAHGVAEELTTALAQIPTITVRSTARTLQALTAAEDLGSVGRRLSVALLLDGSVQHGAGRLRITLRLVRTADEVTLWARAFDVDSLDTILAQQQVARAAVGELRARLDTLAR
jgi:DNA-binding SARP family transcriptional activator/TolB-like protein